MNREHFAENLRRLRLENGFTQDQLAEKMGTSPRSISRWECGNSLPDVMQLPALAQIYGVTAHALFRDEIDSYHNYARRLLSVYEFTGKTEDFLLTEREFERLLTDKYTADDLRVFGVLYHHMTRYCILQAQKICAIREI